MSTRDGSPPAPLARSPPQVVPSPLFSVALPDELVYPLPLPKPPKPGLDDTPTERFTDDIPHARTPIPVDYGRNESGLTEIRKKSTSTRKEKKNGDASGEKGRPHLPARQEDDQLPSSLIDRAWFGLESPAPKSNDSQDICASSPVACVDYDPCLADTKTRLDSLSEEDIARKLFGSPTISERDQEPGSDESLGSCITHDSGYESLYNPPHDRIQEPHYCTFTAPGETRPDLIHADPSEEKCISRRESTAQKLNKMMKKTEGFADDVPITPWRCVSRQLDNGFQKSDSSPLEKETTPETVTEDTGSIQASPETPETLTCSSVDHGEASLDSSSENGSSPRSPSPWQEVDDEDTRHRLSLALSQITCCMSDMLSSKASSDASLGCSRTCSPETAVVDGASGQSDQGHSSNTSQSTTSSGYTNSGKTGAESSMRGVRRTHRRNDSNKEPDDGEGNEPDPKRRKPGTAEQPVAGRRFACPYQKYDLMGSPFCCAKTAKNPEGGAENFSRVKSHVLRNHDPFVRCDVCWKMCKTKEGVVEHKEKEDCVPRASPAKYWMTAEQRDQVRRRRFTCGNVENWFSLFGILCPNYPAAGPDGYKTKISPYFMDSDQMPSIPSFAPWCSHQAASSGPVQDSDPTLEGTQQSSNRNTLSQLLAYQDQRMREAPIDFSSLLNVQEGDLAMDDPLPLDDSTFDFRDATYPSFSHPIDNSSQPGLFPGPASASPVDEPMATADIAQPPLESGGATSPSSEFLRLDNARLRNSNKQLAEEVRDIGKQYSEAQAKTGKFRDELRQLGNSLEELLYQPSVQNGDREVMARLFEISNRVTGISKALGSGA